MASPANISSKFLPFSSGAPAVLYYFLFRLKKLWVTMGPAPQSVLKALDALVRELLLRRAEGGISRSSI